MERLHAGLAELDAAGRRHLAAAMAKFADAAGLRVPDTESRNSCAAVQGTLYQLVSRCRTVDEAAELSQNFEQARGRTGVAFLGVMSEAARHAFDIAVRSTNAALLADRTAREVRAMLAAPETLDVEQAEAAVRRRASAKGRFRGSARRCNWRPLPSLFQCGGSGWTGRLATMSAPVVVAAQPGGDPGGEPHRLRVEADVDGPVVGGHGDVARADRRDGAEDGLPRVETAGVHGLEP